MCIQTRGHSCDPEEAGKEVNFVVQSPLAVFGGRKRKSTRSPSHLGSMVVQISWFEGAFLHKRQDDCTALRRG